jgi:Mce-associated membrane protein
MGDTGRVTAALPPPSNRRVLGVLAVAFLVASIVLGLVVARNTSSRSDLTSAQEDAVSAARQAIKNLDSLSAATVDADLKRVVDGATGSFKEQFTKAQAELKKVVVQRKTVSSATVLSAGLQRADLDSATVLVAVDRTVTDTSTPNGVIAHDRWKMQVEKHGGRWLLATLEPVA